MIRRQLLTSLIVVVVMTVGLGLVYPFVVTGIAQVAFGAGVPVIEKPLLNDTLFQGIRTALGRCAPRP